MTRIPLTRRTLLAAGAASLCRGAAPETLFNGRSLDGWRQIENNATILSAGGIIDPPAFFTKLATSPDSLSTWLRTLLPPPADEKAVIKALNDLINGASVYEPARFRNIALRPETTNLLSQNPTGYRLARLNKLLLEDAYPADLVKSATTGWIVKDAAMASTGSGRGVIYTAQDYTRFRLTFTERHVSGNPDHQACVLIFCTRPGPDEKPLDALGGIQFQPPNGGRWDYRPGRNNNGGDLFTLIDKSRRFDPHEWSRVEIVADASNGTARMSVAQPVSAQPVEVLRFSDPTAGKPGPIAWQMHNAGLFDEYKEITIEVL